MDNTRIQLSTGFLTLPKGADFPITLSVKEITSQGKRSGGFSKVIEIDGTDNNTTLLGSYFDIDLSNNKFDRNKKTTCSVIQNGVENFEGFIQLKEVIRVNENRATNGKRLKYKIVVFDQVSNFFNEMGDKELTDLSFPELSHTFNRTNIIASWSNTEGYTYPQFAKQDNIYTLRDFKPAIYEWEYWKKIFASNGYSFTFDQYNESTLQIDKRIIPYNGKNGDDSISQFLKQSYTVRGTLASETYLIDEAQMPTYPFGWIPVLDFTSANAINDYCLNAGSKVVLDTILEDAQSQYDVLTGELTNLGGQGRTFQILTSYDYDIDVRAKNDVGTVVSWEVDNTLGGISGCEVKITLVAQSTTDNTKTAYIDAGTTVVNFTNGGTYTYASGWQTLGSGTNASFADLGLFDANEAFDVHAVIMGRYIDNNGALQNTFTGALTQIVDLDTSAILVNVPCKFVDQSTGEDVRLEFDISITNLEFKAVPDITELVKGSAVDIDKFIPKGIKQRELISAVMKTYNLYPVPDPDNERNIIVKTRDKYYDDGSVWDWTDKFQEAQPNSITFLNNEVKRDQVFKYKDAKDTINSAYQNEFTDTYGESLIVLDNEYTVGTDVNQVMYSPTPSVQSGLGFPLPSINGINPEGNLRVLLHNGLGTIYQYPFYDDIVTNASELAFISEYNMTSMFDSDFTPNFSICFNAPKVIFHAFQAGQTSNYIYNLHHQRETTTINQGSRLTGYFNQTELDFQKLSQRLDWTIYIKDNGYFYIEKVHNYNATKRTLTKVDLITADEKSNLKVLNPQPPIKPNILYDDVVTDFYTDVADDTNIVIGSGQVQIQGAYNFVTGDNVFIQGNQNTVNANGAKVMGDNNTVPAGLSKTTVIGNEQTASKSGVIIEDEGFDNRITVTQANKDTTLGGIIDSTKEYFLDGVIDMGSTQITVPVGGMTIKGYSFDISGLKSSADNYTMFVSESIDIGSGNMLGSDYYISVTGANSKVYEIYDATGFNAFEFSRINYIDCTSLGDIYDYRQGLEDGTGRFGGSPSLTLHGLWRGGYRITTSIVRGLAGTMTAPLFKGGTLFQMNSRFLTDINCDLPTLASLFDFAPSNFVNPSTVQVQGALVSRNGSFDATDTNITPNITQADIKSSWSNNIGMRNTFEGGKLTLSTETATVLSGGSYSTIAGTWTASNLEHFDNPSGGELRHLGTSPREYKCIVNFIIDGGPNDDIGIRVRKWDDSASAFVDGTEVRRQINSFVGGRDVAFYNFSFSVELDQNDYIFFQVRNNTDNTNVTLEIDSDFVIEER